MVHGPHQEHYKAYHECQSRHVVVDRHHNPLPFIQFVARAHFQGRSRSAPPTGSSGPDRLGPTDHLAGTGPARRVCGNGGGNPVGVGTVWRGESSPSPSRSRAPRLVIGVFASMAQMEREDPTRRRHRQGRLVWTRRGHHLRGPR